MSVITLSGLLSKYEDRISMPAPSGSGRCSIYSGAYVVFDVHEARSLARNLLAYGVPEISDLDEVVLGDWVEANPTAPIHEFRRAGLRYPTDAAATALLGSVDAQPSECHACGGMPRIPALSELSNLALRVDDDDGGYKFSESSAMLAVESAEPISLLSVCAEGYACSLTAHVRGNCTMRVAIVCEGVVLTDVVTQADWDYRDLVIRADIPAGVQTVEAHVSSWTTCPTCRGTGHNIGGSIHMAELYIHLGNDTDRDEVK